MSVTINRVVCISKLVRKMTSQRYRFVALNEMAKRLAHNME